MYAIRSYYVTLDMASNMGQIAKVCFPAARQVVDRFHVQQLAFEAVQEMRIKARWEAMDKENLEIAYSKACGQTYQPGYTRSYVTCALTC